MKVNIDIPSDMVKAIDATAEKEFFSRSEWIRTAIRSKLFPPPEGIQYDLQQGNHGQVSTPRVTVPMAENLESITHASSGTKGSRDGDYFIEWCQANFAHPFERGVTRKCLKVTVVDAIDGNPAYLNGRYFDNRYMCEECIKKVNETEGIALKEGGTE